MLVRLPGADLNPGASVTDVSRGESARLAHRPLSTHHLTMPDTIRPAMARRDLLRFGLGGGVAAILGAWPAGAAPTTYTDSAVRRRHPLEFRLDSEWRPDLSEQAAGRLVAATMAFLDAEHPDGLTMTFWELSPRDMPFLGRHLELIVEAVFRGVRDQLAIRPVDPLIVLALLYNESRFHPKVVSGAGAVGMAQFMPDTAVEFGLSPIAERDLWLRYRQTRAAYLRGRRSRIREFRTRYGLTAFDVDRAVDRAIASGDVTVLADYRALTEEPDPSEEALADYLAAVESAFAKYEFFWDGREPLEALDGRVGYEAITRTVRYLALRMQEHQGMVSSAVASYNSGPGSVRVSNPDSILHRFGDIPPYAETVRYVQRFMAVYTAIKYRLYRVELGES
jgi:hypothetical protein